MLLSSMQIQRFQKKCYAGLRGDNIHICMRACNRCMCMQSHAYKHKQFSPCRMCCGMTILLLNTHASDSMVTFKLSVHFKYMLY